MNDVTELVYGYLVPSLNQPGVYFLFSEPHREVKIQLLSNGELATSAWLDYQCIRQIKKMILMEKEVVFEDVNMPKNFDKRVEIQELKAAEIIRKKTRRLNNGILNKKPSQAELETMIFKNDG